MHFDESVTFSFILGVMNFMAYLDWVKRKESRHFYVISCSPCDFYVNSVDADNAKHIPDLEEVSGPKGVELSKEPIDLKSGDWAVKIVLG